jgi:hypothetical protein
MKKSRTSAGALMLAAGWALIISVGSAFGADSPLWGGLQPGPFGVGFKTIELFDNSRSFQPEKDFFGAPIAGESARPVQVCYWYPTTKDTTGTTMVYSEYAFPYPADSRLFPMLSNLQNREMATIFAFTRGNQAMVSRLMNYRLLAVRDVSPASGVFPLIVYHGSERGAYSQNAVLCEYLASQGFIVVTTHVVGASGFDSSDQPPDIEAAARDKELAVAAMHELPFVNTQKLGLIGYNYGITTALIHQMRNYSVDAVATLHARYTMDMGGATLARSNSYSPSRMQASWLALFPDSAGQPLDLGLLDTLKYCRRYSVKMPQVRPMEFTIYGVMAAVAGADSTRTAASAQTAHSSIAPYLLKFFDACLNDNQSSRDWLEKGPQDQNASVAVLAARELVPTPEQFQNIIQTYGVARAKELCDKFGFPTAENPVLADATYTAMGYRFLQTGDTPSALQVFAWGVLAWPGSANAWDSYGEACAASGDLDAGLANYRKALEALPNDTAIDPNMRTQLETSIPANIARLEQEIAARSNSGGGSR